MLFNKDEIPYAQTLARHGYALHKDRQPVKGLGFGYMVVQEQRNFAVLGATNWNYDASLDDVREFARSL